MKHLSSLFAILLLVGSVYAQPPATLWTKTYGGTNYDGGADVQQTTDGGFICLGSTQSSGAGNMDVWLVKTNPNGDLIWSQTFGGGGYEQGNQVLQTFDGGYAIAAYTTSFGSGSYDAWLIRADQNGQMLWNRTYGQSGSDGVYGILQDASDGGFILTGWTNAGGASPGGEVWLIKTDALGNLLWSRTFGSSLQDCGLDVAKTEPDNGFIIAGFTHASGGWDDADAWLIKTDESGNMQWNQSFGDYPATADDIASGVVQTTDGGYAAVGFTETYSSSARDVWLFKTDDNGNLVWQRTFNGGDDFGSDLHRTGDGGYIISGTYAYGSSAELWVIKTNSDGTLQWDIKTGGNGLDVADHMNITSDGGYIITGSTWSFGMGLNDLWLVRLAGPPVGQITGNVDPPFPGITVDLYQAGQHLDFDLTDDEGTYSFPDLEPGDYSVELVVPLGFTVDQNPKSVTLEPGETETINFTLAPIVTSNTARSKGYWKHQVNANGNTDYSQAEMLSLGQEIYDHFYFNPVHPIQVDSVTFAADSSCALSITDMRTMLNINQNGSTMYQRACQQYLTLLLNLVSNKVGQLTLASADGVTHSQAVVYIHQLLGVNNELAKNIAETLNNAQMVANGVIPFTTPMVIFSDGVAALNLMPTEFSMGASPNPFNPITTLSFSLPAAARVKLSVFDIFGRQVAALVDGFRDAGVHEVSWDAGGLPSGIYCARLEAGNRSAVQKLVLMK